MRQVDRRRYTEPELHNLAATGQLPGFLNEAFYGPELVQGTAWQPVHNMAVVCLRGGEPCSAEANLSILTAIRSRETNETHPDVVSTPTRRMTSDQARGIIVGKAEHVRASAKEVFLLSEVNPARPRVIATFKPNLEPLSWQHGLPLLVDELAHNKLGMDELDRDTTLLWEGLGKASLSKLVAGFSYVDDTNCGEPRFEPIIMFGSVVSSDLIPLPMGVGDKTNDYRNITWTPVARFAENVKERRVADLVVASEWDEVYACVRGLCLATSVQTTVDLNDLWRHLGYSDLSGFRNYHRPDLGVDVIGLI